ncbi:HAMP domain-containing sensor histidine kinase [Pseudanabaena sp. FACHB-2040]|uniref:histidine kinase dimerization/phospho-acceptor domain-containing protein n=1 Tax=Pseudanabaena sp. FACHB-2040 TaxID=2692859 RepID=UPI0016845D0A|nr:HAMP domain-containing histidine kinase [Pseudanabaena sp. FACHB-2040]
MNQNYPSLSELLASDEAGGASFWPDAAAAGVWESSSSAGASLGQKSPSTSDRNQQRLQAEAEWWSAIAALTHMLHAHLDQGLRADEEGLATWEGMVLSGPLPVLWDQSLGQRLSSWVLIPQPLEGLLAVARPLLPDDGKGGGHSSETLQTIPLPAGDPLSAERFCLVLTPTFSLSLVLANGPQGRPQFQFSFEPKINQQVWQQLRSRVAQIRPPLLPTLDSVAEPFAPQPPHYQVVTQFTRLLLTQLRHQFSTSSASATADPEVRLASWEVPAAATANGFSSPPASQPLGLLQGAAPADGASAEPATADATGRDAELLKAMAHEIRTPLTTIRTFTRSLLKRKDLPEEAIKRLKLIDRECTQQIDRFNLIFRAVELETEGPKQPHSTLTAISLSQIFQDSIALWQQQAQRRNLTLEVKVPSQMPMVTSDSTMLNQVLTGLIDRFTHSLPPYSHIKLVVSLAGHQLKLQFQSQPKAEAKPAAETSTCQRAAVSPFRSVGHLLMFQPETGGLSLNLAATKNLFQALGGKLIVRQKPQRGEVLTVYLPLETRSL